MSNSYRDLIAWQKAVALVTDVYRWTDKFPKDELYGLKSQMRRAAVSIAANIAEGQGRNTAGEFIQFLGTAKGSLVELETHFFIAANLAFISEPTRDSALARTDEVSRLVNGLKLALGKHRSQSVSRN
jgi:four helix bundle protein